MGDDGTGIRAVVNIPFARLNCATSARRLFNSAIASSADCLVSAATVASILSRQRCSVSGAPPGSLATCSIALVSDGYEPRDSVSSLTAFALNSGVYLVPFAMVPSSPIELGEMRNENQFISGSATPVRLVIVQKTSPKECCTYGEVHSRLPEKSARLSGLRLATVPAPARLTLCSAAAS